MTRTPMLKIIGAILISAAIIGGGINWKLAADRRDDLKTLIIYCLKNATSVDVRPGSACHEAMTPFMGLSPDERRAYLGLNK
jgi:hypothetical protein